MDKFQRRHKPLKIIQEQITWLILYLINKLKFSLKCFPQRKLQSWVTSLMNSIKYLRKKYYQEKFFQKIEEESFTSQLTPKVWHFPNTKPKDTTRQLQTNSPHKLDIKFLKTLAS